MINMQLLNFIKQLKVAKKRVGVTHRRVAVEADRGHPIEKIVPQHPTQELWAKWVPDASVLGTVPYLHARLPFTRKRRHCRTLVTLVLQSMRTPRTRKANHKHNDQQRS